MENAVSDVSTLAGATSLDRGSPLPRPKSECSSRVSPPYSPATHRAKTLSPVDHLMIDVSSPVGTEGGSTTTTSSVSTPESVEASSSGPLAEEALMPIIVNAENATMQQRKIGGLGFRGSPVPCVLPSPRSAVGMDDDNFGTTSKMETLNKSDQKSESTGEMASSRDAKDADTTIVAGVESIDLNVVTAKNAQAFYKPEACVFIGNLPKGHSDHIIKQSLDVQFGNFGLHWSKIMRSRDGMPYAIAQFTNKEDAKRALLHGSEIIVHGRQCRVEPARCHRALLVSTRSGEPMDVEAKSIVTAMLQRYGAIERDFAPSETEREIFGLPNGIWYRFVFFADCQKANKGLRNNSVYRFQLLVDSKHTNDAYVQQQASCGSHSRIPGMPHESSPSIVHLSYLPLNVDENEIYDTFTRFGEILDIQIIGVQVNSDNEIDPASCPCAFVAFRSLWSARAAVASEETSPVEMCDTYEGLWYSVKVEWLHRVTTKCHATHIPTTRRRLNLGRFRHGPMRGPFPVDFHWNPNTRAFLHSGVAHLVHPEIAALTRASTAAQTGVNTADTLNYIAGFHSGVMGGSNGNGGPQTG